ncbi:MAG: AbrB/MazE/SpoVT family DNA-binding domain-containing protein [Deltaproteobacteria bacterium]|nr:AbrB/MazE/SpoVT family DNA-binding domain-containing protein [Deltaproteobacteria bacterium]
MAGIATTKLSSKGQVVIPESIRKKLQLKTGAQFVVVADKDVVILKNIAAPTLDEFDGLIAKARKNAKQVGLKKNDIKNAMPKVRRK